MTVNICYQYQYLHNEFMLLLERKDKNAIFRLDLIINTVRHSQLQTYLMK